MGVLQKLERQLTGAFWLLPPDIHERQRFIASLTPSGQKVLDVGGEQRILGERVGAADFYTVNVDTSSNQTPKHQAKTQRDFFYDGKHLPFDDAFFDTVVCIDVLEHVPPKQRTALIKEMLRVAKGQLICSAPLGTVFHQKAEQQLYDQLKDQGMNVDFLEEHIKYGLPTPKEVMDWADTFKGQVWYAGDVRLANQLFWLNGYQSLVGPLNHAIFFARLALYAVLNVCVYPMMVGWSRYGEHTNRFYMQLRR